MLISRNPILISVFSSVIMTGFGYGETPFQNFEENSTTFVLTVQVMCSGIRDVVPSQDLLSVFLGDVLPARFGLSLSRKYVYMWLLQCTLQYFRFSKKNRTLLCNGDRFATTTLRLFT